MTECNEQKLSFQPSGRREIVAEFQERKHHFRRWSSAAEGGERAARSDFAVCGVISQFADCFDDYRDPEQIEHPVEQLLAQRIFGIALGYEDLNDHDQLRHDSLLAVACGAADPTGRSLMRREDRGKALAGRNTLNRLELTPARADENSRFKKIVARHSKTESFFVDMFLQMHADPPAEIVLDLDATDDPLHGHQLGRFFHGYYKSYC